MLGITPGALRLPLCYVQIPASGWFVGEGLDPPAGLCAAVSAPGDTAPIGYCCRAAARWNTSAPTSGAFCHVRSDVQAVVHNHSIYATAYAINGMPIVSDALTEMNVTFGQVPVVPYGTPGTDRIYRDFDKYLGNYSAVLLANHGVLAFGQGLEKAFSVAEAVEKVAQTLYIARQLGEPSPIPKEEVKALREFGEQMRIKEIENIINLENKRS